MAARNRIYSLRKGSVQWNEEDRLAMASMLIKAGYVVRIGRCPVEGKEDKKNAPQQYYVEYWEEATEYDPLKN